MPQIQPGQVEPGQSSAPKLYGTQKTENSIPFQEKLMRLFRPQEFVTIRNITNEPCYWQYMPVDNEQEAFSEDGLQKIITRTVPEMWVIGAGETEVLVGVSAYRALDAMYKNWMATRTLQRFKDPTSPQFNEDGKYLPKNFNFADGGSQDEFIEQAYIGKAVPTFGGEPAPTVSEPGITSNPDDLHSTAIPTAQPPLSPPTISNPIATSQTNPTIKPMQPAPPIVNDDVTPVPKTTVGTPLEPVNYANPDGPDPMAAAKELTSAKN